MPAYKMKLTMLSPVHVGSGEEVEPTEYVVRKSGSGNRALPMFYTLDLPRLLSRLAPAQLAEFNKAADSGSLLYLRKYIDKVADLARDVRWRATCSEDLHDAYAKALEKDTALLAIVLMARDGLTGNAYIPGSSIKGALRTAWLSRGAAAYAANHDLNQLHERDFEPAVLGYQAEGRGGRLRAEIRADPLRALQVGDAPLCANSNCIDPVRIYKPNRPLGAADPAGIQMYYDITFSRLDDETIEAQGRLVVNDALMKTRVDGARNWSFEHCVAGAFDADELIAACNTFYIPRLEDEIERFPVLEGCADALRAEVGKLGTREALIRLGRFSHIECVTVARDGGTPVEKGTTRSLVAGEYPLGWVKLSLSPMA